MSEWISVEERLPEPGQLVLALYPQQWHLRKDAASHGNSPDWNCTLRELVPVCEPRCRWADEGVTYWMPFSPPNVRDESNGM